MLECWRHLGHLYCGPVASDYEHYVENSAYARFVLGRSAASNARNGTSPSDRRTSGVNQPVAFQTGVVPKAKAGD